MRTTGSKKSSFFRALLLIAIVAVLSAAAFAFYHKDRKQPVSNNGSGSASTYTAHTEGSDIEVPTGVDPSKIKDYQLITENEQYKIRRLGDTYTITLYAIINRPDQRDMYLDQLREYKQNALDYLNKSGIDTKKIKIVYEPEEASSL